MAGGLLSRLLSVDDHPGVIENAIAEFAVCGEAGVVHVVDSIASQRVTAGVGASSVSPRFVIAAIGQKLVTDVSIFRAANDRAKSAAAPTARTMPLSDEFR